MLHLSRALPLALALTLTPALARAGSVHWPTTGVERETVDPIAALRWTVARQWTSPAPVQLNPLLRAADEALARPGAAPVWHARRAVILRVMDRPDEARRALDAALAASPELLTDPDVALTQGYLLARAGQFDRAVAIAREALGRLAPAAPHRAELAVEIARWSMARGHEGLPDALALLREVSALGAPEPTVRATLALALWRNGNADEAREVARGGSIPQPYGAESLTPHGALLPGEPEAAVGAALLLAGRGHDAVDLLTRAAAQSPAAWRPGLTDLLAQARRAPAPAASPATSAMPTRPLRIIRPSPPHRPVTGLTW